MQRFSNTILFYSVLICAQTASAIQPDEPPFALTIEQAKRWTPSATFADQRNVSDVPLKRRSIAALGNGVDSLDRSVKVLYAPDGMNNFGNYLQTQLQSNLYNFTSWAYIDILNWFAGTAEHAVQIPAKPWVDTAHRNGVKVIGSVFLAVAQWGGSADTVEALLAQDPKGRFILADKLIEIANYYGFDGWLINQETDLTAVKDANNQLLEGQKNSARGAKLGAKFLQFMEYLTTNTPAHMEIHWYDSQLLNGEVVWQNELNDNNKMFLQNHSRTADAIFLNYWWDQPMLANSRQNALALKRSHYDVYIGADLWPQRTAQKLFENTKWLADVFDQNGVAYGSIALFAPNVNFNFMGDSQTPHYGNYQDKPENFAQFYQTEHRLFSGDNLNIAAPSHQAWQGIAQYLPAKAVATVLPFETNFNVGQGLHYFDRGQKTQGPWSNIAKQSLLPTWHFAIQALDSLDGGLQEDERVSINYDLNTAWQGGSSLYLEASKRQTPFKIPLYYLDLNLHADHALEVVFKGSVKGLALYLETAQGEVFDYPIGEVSDRAAWQREVFTLSELKGRHIKRMGLLSQGNERALAMHLGKLAIF